MYISLCCCKVCHEKTKHSLTRTTDTYTICTQYITPNKHIKVTKTINEYQSVHVKSSSNKQLITSGTWHLTCGNWWTNGRKIRFLTNGFMPLRFLRLVATVVFCVGRPFETCSFLWCRSLSNCPRIDRIWAQSHLNWFTGWILILAWWWV